MIIPLLDKYQKCIEKVENLQNEIEENNDIIRQLKNDVYHYINSINNH